MLALRLILSMTYYAQNYAGIIGGSLEMENMSETLCNLYRLSKYSRALIIIKTMMVLLKLRNLKKNQAGWCFFSLILCMKIFQIL